jgi:hypothetical protein
VTAKRCPRCNTAHRDAQTSSVVAALPLMLALVFEFATLPNGPILVALVVMQGCLSVIAAISVGVVWAIMRARARGWLS